MNSPWLSQQRFLQFFLLSTIAGISPPAAADLFSAGNWNFNIRPPENYCQLSNSPIEKEIFERINRSLQPKVLLAYAAADCHELEDLRSGREKFLKHWLQVQILQKEGQVAQFPISKEAFVAAMAGGKPKIDLPAVEKKIREAFDNPELRMAEGSANILGRDGNAAYLSINMDLKITQNQSSKVFGVGAMTLINSIPMVIIAYQSQSSSRGPTGPSTALRSTLTSLLVEN